MLVFSLYALIAILLEKTPPELYWVISKSPHLNPCLVGSKNLTLGCVVIQVLCMVNSIGLFFLL